MICARCRHAFQCIVSNDDTWTTGSQPVGRQQLHGDNETHADGPEELDKWRTFTHHPTHESFREAIDQRCSVCIVLWEELEGERQSLLIDAIRSHEDDPSVTALETSYFRSGKRQTDAGGYWINVDYSSPVPVSGTRALPFFRSRVRVFILEPINGESCILL